MLLLLSLASASSTWSAPPALLPYQNPSLSSSERIHDLMARIQKLPMRVDEKAYLLHRACALYAMK